MTITLYSCWSNTPGCAKLLKKLRRVSAARRASSCVGELGDDPMGVAPDIEMPAPADAVDLPPRLLLLLTRWSAVGEEMPAAPADEDTSRPKAGPVISCAGDSSADDGAVFSPLLLYLGVRDSPFLPPLPPSALPGPFMYSRFSRFGKVWLLGRWKFAASAPGGTPDGKRPCCCCCWG